MSARAKRLTGAVTGALAAAIAVWAAVAAPGAGGTPVQLTPLPIKATSLSQDGRQLVWRVGLGQPFSPGALAREGRALCLVLFARRGASGELCIAGPPRGASAPRILYTRLAHGSPAGPARRVAATIGRSSDRELTATFVPTDVGIGYVRLRWNVVTSVEQSPCGAAAGSCSTAESTPPAALALHTPQLAGCVPSGPSWVFHGPTNVHEIALTLDDGPWYDTGQFLGLLEREHVVATFFQIGDQIAQYGEHGVDRRMLADGDMIGDHTWSYGSPIGAQIAEAAAAIRSATGGFEPCLFRAPGGNVTPGMLSTARSLGFATIQWDIDPRDWTRPGTAAIYDNVIANAHDGAIVIQHDGGGDRAETLAALPAEIDALRRRGYRFVTLTQMLGYRLVYR